MSQPRSKRRKTAHDNSLLWKYGRMNSRRNINGKDGNECPVLGCSYNMDDSELLQHIHDIVAYKVDPDSLINLFTRVVNHKNWKPFQCEFCSDPSQYFFNKNSLGSHRISSRLYCMQNKITAVDVENYESERPEERN